MRFLQHDDPPPHRPAPEGCTCVFVGNMPFDITESIVRKLFQRCGTIRSIRFCEDEKTGEFRGFGYVSFLEKEACEQALMLAATPVMGRLLRIDYDTQSTEQVTKKGVCHKFQRGECTRGEDCKFAHVVDENSTTQASDVTLKFQKGKRGEDCTFEHVPLEAKEVCLNFQKGKCKRGDKCRFDHAPVNKKQRFKPRQLC